VEKTSVSASFILSAIQSASSFCTQRWVFWQARQPMQYFSSLPFRLISST